MFTEEQYAGIEDLLYRKWEEATRPGPPHPDIQIPQVQREGWGQDLSDEHALILIEYGLEYSGDWHVGEPIRGAQGTWGYQYTDAKTAANAPPSRYRRRSF